MPNGFGLACATSFESMLNKIMNFINIKAFLKAASRHPAILLMLGFAVIILSQILAGFSDGVVFMLFGGKSGASRVIAAFITAGLAIGFYWAFTRYVERKPFVDFQTKGALKEWGIGAVIGFGVMSATVAIMAILGGYRMISMNPISVLLPVLAIAITSGVIEEILLRGIFFRFIEQWLGSWSALILSAGLFGALHMPNPNATLLSSFAIALEAGILLAAIYMVTRRLWAAIGLHMAWNFTQGGIYGVSVSGFKMDGLIKPEINGDPLLTGGAFGAEASVPAIILCTAVGLMYLKKAYQSNQFVPASWVRFKSGDHHQNHL